MKIWTLRLFSRHRVTKWFFLKSDDCHRIDDCNLLSVTKLIYLKENFQRAWIEYWFISYKADIWFYYFTDCEDLICIVHKKNVHMLMKLVFIEAQPDRYSMCDHLSLTFVVFIVNFIVFSPQGSAGPIRIISVTTSYKRLCSPEW